MRIAYLDCQSGISGDMTLGALVSLGLPASWLETLPNRLGLSGIGVSVRDVRRSGVQCTQVEFSIPSQPHGRHVGELIRMIQRAEVSDWVKERAIRAFQLVGEAEGRVHGVAPEKAARAANYLAMKVITQIGARLHSGARSYWDEALV